MKKRKVRMLWPNVQIINSEMAEEANGISVCLKSIHHKK